MKFKFRGKRHDLCEMLHCLCHGKQVYREVTYSYKGVSFTTKGQVMLKVKATEVPGTVNVSVVYKDAKGNPAQVDGVPTWLADNTAVVDSIAASADGKSAQLHITDTLGATNLTNNADVDLGSGVQNVDFVDTVSVIAGDAVAAEFTFDTVVADGTVAGGGDVPG